MDSMYIYQLIGLVHFIGFIIYMGILKFGLNKSVTEKKLGYYVLGWIIVLLVYLIIAIIIYEIPFDENIAIATAGELTGLTIGFLVIDYIIWIIGKWFYKKIIQKKK